MDINTSLTIFLFRVGKFPCFLRYLKKSNSIYDEGSFPINIQCSINSLINILPSFEPAIFIMLHPSFRPITASVLVSDWWVDKDRVYLLTLIISEIQKCKERVGGIINIEVTYPIKSWKLWVKVSWHLYMILLLVMMEWTLVIGAFVSVLEKIKIFVCIHVKRFTINTVINFNNRHHMGTVWSAETAATDLAGFKNVIFLFNTFSFTFQSNWTNSKPMTITHISVIIYVNFCIMSVSLNPLLITMKSIWLQENITKIGYL